MGQIVPLQGQGSSETWQANVTGTLQGLDLTREGEQIDDTQTVECVNAVPYKGQLFADHGYTAEIQAGDLDDTPIRWCYRYGLQTSLYQYNVAVTNKGIYFKNPTSNQWEPVYKEGITALSATIHTQNALVENDTDIELGSSNDIIDTDIFEVNDIVWVLLDDGTWHKTALDSVLTGNSIRISTGVPSAAAADNKVIIAHRLNGSNANPVSGVYYEPGKALLITNQIDPVLAIRASSSERFTSAQLRDTPQANPSIAHTYCNAIGIIDSSVVYIGYGTDSGFNKSLQVSWCDKGSYNILTPDSSNDAGYEQLYDHAGGLIAAYPYDQELIIYREGAITRMIPVNRSTKRFEFRTENTDEGAVALHGVVKANNAHMFLGETGLWLYVGESTVQPFGQNILEHLMRPYGLLSRINLNRSWLYYDQQDNRIFIGINNGSSVSGFPNTVFIGNLDNGQWFERRFGKEISYVGALNISRIPTWDELNFPWDTFTATWEDPNLKREAPPHLCCSDGCLYQYSVAHTTDNGEPVDGFVVTKEYGHPYSMLYMDYVEFKAQGGTIDLYYRRNGEVDWTLLKNLTFPARGDTRRVMKNIRFRSIQFKFQLGSGTVLQSGPTIVYQTEIRG